MIVNCGTMKEGTETATNLPAPADSCNQATGGEDSSVKTINFLRARLLSERAASKAAREQAQQIANKVKDLQAQLERESEQRKEAQTSISKIFDILKAKGLAVDDLAFALHESGLTKLDVIKEAMEEPSVDKREVSGVHMLPPTVPSQQVPLRKGDLSIDKGVSAELSKEGMVEQREHGTVGIQEANVGGDMVNASKCTDDIRDALVTENSSIQLRSHVEEDEVKYAVISSKSMGMDKSRSDCASDSNKDASRITDPALAMTHKLKAIVHQMEEEVHALPMEQPLKAEIQHWMDRVVSVLDNGNDKAGESNQPQDKLTDLDINSSAQEHDREFDARDESTMTRSPAVHYERLMQSNLDNPSHSFNGDYQRTTYPLFDPVEHSATFHSRRKSCDSFNVSFSSQNMPNMQWHEQSSLARNNPPYPFFLSAQGHSVYGQDAGAELPYFLESQSPKSSVGSFSAKVLYDQGQWCDGSSLGRISSFRSQGKLGEQIHPAPLSSAFVNDAADSPCINKQDYHFRRLNVSLDKRLGYHRSTYTNQGGRVPREEDDKGYTNRLPNGHLNDAMLSLVDDKHGRLGQVLTNLDAVWQQVNSEDQFVASPMPTLHADPRCNRGHHFGDGTWQPRPYHDHPYHPWRARAHSQAAPIVQFPPSPSSEHGYSPFHRHERHRRSSSVATEFMMSGGWDGYLQPRGEVQLGNGITLYTE